MTPSSMRAIANIRKICEERLQGSYDFEVLDMSERPGMALDEDIVAYQCSVKTAAPGAPFRGRYVADRAHSRPAEGIRAMSVDAENLQIEELRAENADLRTRLEEAEDVLRAIRSGEVDALVIGDHLYTLASADAVSNWLRGEMLAQVNDAIVAVDNNNRVIFLNSAAERQYG